MARSRGTSDPLGRRRFLGGLTSAAALLTLSACGVSESGDDEKEASSEERSLKTDKGVVKVPQHPKRVAASWNYDALMLLELGLVPVAVPDGTASRQLMPRDIFDKLEGVKTTGAPGTPNAQAVAAAKPDLIIDQFSWDKTKALRKIAPVVYYDWAHSGALWHEQLAKVAKAVNREERLNAERKKYEARLKELKSTYRKQIAGTKWAILSGGQNSQFQLGGPLLTVMRDLGLKIGAGIKGGADFQPKSYEQMDVLDDCTALIYPTQFDGKPPPPTQDLLDSKLWKSVPAVKDDKAFPIKHYTMCTYRFALGALDEIEDMLKKA
ncbi:ABC transporter substrate-binding protein [Streptomyces sp. HNM0575]|uniref:ABC transporter substrate-binding protein n=1 Tax=Streptomyces sp. HNM0575 TaxID=2716338 RepID=UPI00145DC9CB|nr:ABC transporter substrate-binding protein [Streptomyces sp. HNM0575]NLU73387.1 ABC transporter substrate-binding protein [Streptomyces sp. HNM0575]